MQIENMRSTKGNYVPNQFQAWHKGKTYFQSYDSLCAVWDGEKLVLGHDWDYSVTTQKYLWIWLDDNCYSISRKVLALSGKSRADKVRKAIENCLVIYAPDMR